MDGNGRVSIIVPVYKTEKYLRQCIDSILMQTYPNLQIILVDDGSPDNCGAICDEYALEDNRVCVIHKENGGVSSARNAGLLCVEGEYLTFCDSDDAYKPDWIETLVTAMVNYRAELVIGNYTKVFEDGHPNVVSRHETGFWEIKSNADRMVYCAGKVLTDNHAWECSTRLYCAEIVRENNLHFCETCENYAEDLGFSFSYSLFVGRVVSIEASGYIYNIRDGSMMQSSKGRIKLNALNEVALFSVPVLEKVFSDDTECWSIPVFHYLIMETQYYYIHTGYMYNEFPQLIAQIQRYEEWNNYVKGMFLHKKELVQFFGQKDARRIMLWCRYCVHKNYNLFFVDKWITRLLNREKKLLRNGEIYACGKYNRSDL